MSVTLTFPMLETERLNLRIPQPTDSSAFETFIGSARARFIDAPAPNADPCFVYRHQMEQV